MVETSQPTSTGKTMKSSQVPFHLGITNCVIGVISIVVSSVAMSLPSNIFHGDWAYNIVAAGEGIWCGIFLILTGILGILTKVKPSEPLYIASGVVGILAAIISFVGFGLSALGVLAYTYVLWNVPLISLYAVVGTMCLSAVPICIVQTVFSFRDKHLSSGDGKATFVHNGPDGTSTVHVYTEDKSRTYTNPHGDYFLALGVAEIALGFVILCLESAALSHARSVQDIVDKSWLAFGYTGIGIWGGLYICASGALGVLYKFRPSVTVINANLAMCMLSATTSILIVVISGLAAITTERRLIELRIALAALGFIAAIVSVVHSAFCCGGVCQRQKAGKGNTVVATGAV